jgi:hypothetical protein
LDGKALFFCSSYPLQRSLASCFSHAPGLFTSRFPFSTVCHDTKLSVGTEMLSLGWLLQPE